MRKPTPLAFGGKLKLPFESVGILLPGQEARIVKEDGSEAAYHEPGELWIRGPNVALGYYGNEKATKETFLPDGWLRTGDEVKFNEEGDMFILDRLKELVKVNGNQVAPAELEGWILNHEEIRFQLREANLRLPWDAHTVAFLATQKKLNALVITTDGKEDGPLCALPAAALQSLEVFSGPVLVAAELLGCPLTRLQMSVDDETALVLPTVVADVARYMASLRKLHIVGMQEHQVVETLQSISTAVFAPKLRLLGILPIPPRDVSV